MTGTKIEIEVEIVDKTGQGMAGVRQRTVADARSAAEGIEREFDRAGSSVASSFDGVASKVGSSFQRTEQAGREAGRKTGENFAEGLEGAAGQIDTGSIGSTISNALQSLGSKGGAVGAAVAVGAIFADEFISGFDRGFNSKKSSLGLQIETGLSSFELQPAGAAAGNAWSKGFGEGLNELASSAALLDNVLGDIDPSTPLQEATKWATILDTHFGVNIPRSAEIAGRMIHQGLAQTTEEAYDVMIGASQRYRASYDEIIDVVREFGTTFGELKITGAEAVDFVGQAWTRGLVPTIDRAGELFEEFVVEVETGSTGRAAPAIEAMGLSFDRVQSMLASGKGKQAIVEIADTLLAMEDTTYRNELAIQIFGTAIESASDKTAILELISEVDNLGESFDGVADDAVTAAERSQSEWDRLSRNVVDGASWMGEQTAWTINDIADKFTWLWNATSVDSDKAYQEMSDKGTVASALLTRVMQSMGTDTSEVWDYFRERAQEGTAAVDETSEAVADLEGAVASFADRFDSDRIMRELAEDADKLTTAAEGTEEQVYSLSDGFNMQTQKGRDLQAQFENLSMNLDDLAEGHRNGTVTSAQLTSGQLQVESAIKAVARQMGLTQEETAALVAKYGTIPTDITTYVNEAGNALSRTEQLAQRLRGLDGTSYSTYINTYTSTSPQRSSGTRSTYSAHGGNVGEPVAAAAGGGAGRPVMVNERGAELARMPEGDIVSLPTGATVMTAEDSHRFLNTGGGSGGGITINLTIMGSLMTPRSVVADMAREMRRNGLGGFGPV